MSSRPSRNSIRTSPDSYGTSPDSVCRSPLRICSSWRRVISPRGSPGRRQRGTGGRLVEVQPPVGDQHADHHRGHRLGHRPADEARVRAVAGGVALGGDLAAVHHHHRAGLAQALGGEQLVDRARQFLGRRAGLLGHRGERLRVSGGSGSGCDEHASIAAGWQSAEQRR